MTRPKILAKLRNMGKATLADFRLLGIATIGELAVQDADALYIRLCETTSKRHDPCVHDVLTATIHEARTGEALDWWACTPARKVRQAKGTFPAYSPPRTFQADQSATNTHARPRKGTSAKAPQAATPATSA